MVKGSTTTRRLPLQVRRRHVSSLGRGRSSHQPRGKVLISCDQLAGSYFSGLVQQLGLSDRVMVSACQERDPVIIVEQALRIFAEKGSFQRLYALVCHDGQEEAWCQAQAIVSNHTLDNSTVFRLVTSTPSFDLWLLLHLVGTSLEYGDGLALAACVRNQLKQHLPMDKLGEGHEIFDVLCHGLPDAIRRSQTLSLLNSTAPGTVPVTEVHEVVSYLLKWQSRL